MFEAAPSNSEEKTPLVWFIWICENSILWTQVCTKQPHWNWLKKVSVLFQVNCKLYSKFPKTYGFVTRVVTAELLLQSVRRQVLTSVSDDVDMMCHAWLNKLTANRRLQTDAYIQLFLHVFLPALNTRDDKWRQRAQTSRSRWNQICSDCAAQRLQVI